MRVSRCFPRILACGRCTGSNETDVSVSITLKSMHPLYPNIITTLRRISRNLSSIPSDHDVSVDLDNVCDTIRRFNSPNEFRAVVDVLVEAMEDRDASETLIELSTPRNPYTPPATPQKNPEIVVQRQSTRVSKPVARFVSSPTKRKTTAKESVQRKRPRIITPESDHSESAPIETAFQKKRRDALNAIKRTHEMLTSEGLQNYSQEREWKIKWKQNHFFILAKLPHHQQLSKNCFRSTPNYESKF